MSMEAILSYLAELEQHNDREWFHDNKARYQDACRSFEELVGGLMVEIRAFDSGILVCDPKELTFKLMRDTRFSHDKSPYNPAFRAHIAAKGKLPVPVGYYIQVKPGGRSFLGGGLFADMFKDATAMVRGRIASHGAEWQRIIDAPEFQQLFAFGGAALKKVPQGYDAQHPQAEFLKYKSWYVEYAVKDEQLLDPGFARSAARVFAGMQPFNAFLNKALEGFQMPTR